MSRTASTARFSTVPVLWLAAFFAVGIAAASYVELDQYLLAGLAGISAFLALAFRASTAATALIVLAFAAAGGVAYKTQVESVRPDRIKVLYDSGIVISGSPVEVEGVITGRPEPSAEGHFLTIRTDRIRYRGEDRKTSGNVRLFLPISNNDVEAPRLKHGSRVVVACSVEREDEYLNPGVLRRPEMLDQMGIDASGSIKSALMIEHIADESVFRPLAWIYDRRADLIEQFTMELSPAAAGVMTASLLGDKHFLDRETAQVFREGGTFHVLVISGLHITFIGGLLLLIVRSATRRRSLQFLITISILWAYAVAVGAEVPVVRATIMFTIVLISYVLYRQASMLNSLGLCALILLVWRPSDLFNASFHLTFVSVAAIIAIAYPLIDGMRKIGKWAPTEHEPFPPASPDWFRRFCEMLYWQDDVWTIESKRQMWSAKLFKSPYAAGRLRGTGQKVVRFLFQGVIVSLAVQVCMLPLLVIYFHRVPAVSVVLNLWVGFFIALESLTVVAGALLSGISELMAAPFFVIAEALNWLLMSLPRLLTGHLWSSLRLPSYTGNGRVIYVIYFLGLIVFAYGLYRWAPMRPWRAGKAVIGTAGVLIVMFVTIIFHPFSAPMPDGRLVIDFLDVGQGDAALVTFPNGRTMLVDGGGRMRFKRPGDDESAQFEPDIRRLGESVVSEFLWHRGYSHVDYLLATHADIDHIQGLSDVARNFRVTGAFLGRSPSDDLELAELRQPLGQQGVEFSIVWAGDVLQFGEVLVEVLYPNPADPSARSDNDSSLVIRIVYGNRSFLLTGDIESQAENDLVNMGGRLSADVIKVPHHGSRTSSTIEFVNAVRPAIAIIPVGRRSPFGHPHPEVVVRWKSVGAEVRTTGEKGTISISTDGEDLQINTFLP